jgi:hypothetical protein
MATPQEELERLNKEIAELKKQLGDFTEFIPLQNLKDAQRLFVQLRRETNSIGDSLDFVARSFRDSVRELSRQNTELSATKTSLRSISSIANKILSTRSLDGEISEKELSILEKKADLQFRSLKISVDSGRLQGEALSEAQAALDVQKTFFTATQSIRKEQAEINKNIGVKLFTGLEDITQAIPGLRKFTSGISEAASATKTQAIFNQELNGISRGLSNNQVEYNEKINQSIDKFETLRTQGLGVSEALKQAGVSAKQIKVGKLPTIATISPLKAGFQSLGPVIAKALGPLALLSEIASSFIKVDKITGNIAKNLGISYQTSLGVTRQFNKIALSSNSLFITTENLAESFVSINKALGTNSSINNEILQTQTELVKQAGFSNEAATQLSILSLATGESAKELTTEFLGQVTLLNTQNNLAINEKQLLESIATISKGTLATFSDQTGELARAAFEARRLGLTLAQIEGIADGLLDIESSIAAEFEAEVISGRQLFLERARFFALNNDLAGVARELAAQDITRVSFAKANRLEQQSIAKALGLSRDELGQMLIEQEALTKLQGVEGNTAQERFNRLVKEVGLAEARKRIGDDTLTNQLASVSAQERFTAAVDKLREALIIPAEILAGMVNNSAVLYTTMAGIGVIMATSIIQSLAKMGVMFASLIAKETTLLGIKTGQAAAQMTTLAAATAGLGVVAALAAAGAGIAYLYNKVNEAKKVEDGIAPSSKGPFTITDKFGAMAVTSPGDSLFASPNIIPSQNNINNNTTIPQTTINNNTTIPQTTINNTTLNRENRNINTTVTLSEQDIRAIANAVREGAMEGTSKANVQAIISNRTVSQLSTRIQPELAVNTYRSAY